MGIRAREGGLFVERWIMVLAVRWGAHVGILPSGKYASQRIGAILQDALEAC